MLRFTADCDISHLDPYLREPDMKIARIETFILGTGSSKDLLFCRIETGDGFYGWGEAYITHGKETVVAECIRTNAPHLIGRSAFNIRHTG
jgi:galactonate dehydratase